MCIMNIFTVILIRKILCSEVTAFGESNLQTKLLVFCITIKYLVSMDFDKNKKSL